MVQNQFARAALFPDLRVSTLCCTFVRCEFYSYTTRRYTTHKTIYSFAVEYQIHDVSVYYHADAADMLAFAKSKHIFRTPQHRTQFRNEIITEHIFFGVTFPRTNDSNIALNVHAEKSYITFQIDNIIGPSSMKIKLSIFSYSGIVNKVHFAFSHHSIRK